MQRGTDLARIGAGCFKPMSAMERQAAHPIKPHRPGASTYGPARERGASPAEPQPGPRPGSGGEWGGKNGTRVMPVLLQHPRGSSAAGTPRVGAAGWGTASPARPEFSGSGFPPACAAGCHHVPRQSTLQIMHYAKKSCFCLLRSCCFADLCVQSTAATFPPRGRCSLEPPQPRAAPGSGTQSSISTPLQLPQAPQESRCLPCPHHLPSEVQPPDPDLQGFPKLNPCNGFTPETQRTPWCRGRLEDHRFMAGLGGSLRWAPGLGGLDLGWVSPGQPRRHAPRHGSGSPAQAVWPRGCLGHSPAPSQPISITVKKISIFYTRTV